MFIMRGRNRYKTLKTTKTKTKNSMLGNEIIKSVKRRKDNVKDFKRKMCLYSKSISGEKSKLNPLREMENNGHQKKCSLLLHIRVNE